MPSTYTTNLGIELPADGELDGVWGDVVNENMDILDRAINGSVALTLSGTTSTLTTSDGALSDGQYKLLVLGGTPSGTHTITIAPSDAQKIYFVRNTTAQSVVFTQGSGGNVTIATGDNAIIYSDGAGAGAAVVNITNDFAMSSVKITGGTIDGTVIGGSSAAAITGTTITGTSFVTTGDMTFGDNDKAIFGDGSDLQIYHSGGGSYIDDTGTGNLLLKTNGNKIAFQNDNGGSPYDMFAVLTSGAIQLNHLSDLKLATTATGIDVTGTVTADGLTVNKGSDGSDIVSLTGASAGRFLNIQSFTNSGAAGAGYDFNATSGQGAIQLSTVNTARLKVDYNGDISFYEDTGTTPKFFWDASAEALGIGTSSPVEGIHLARSNATALIESTDGTQATLDLKNTEGHFIVLTDGGYFSVYDQTNAQTRLRIASSGNVGIGTTIPAYTLDISGGPHVYYDAGNSLGIFSASAGNDVSILARASQNLRLSAGGTERMRITSAGNVGIGTSSPAQRLHVKGVSGSPAIQVETSNGTNNSTQPVLTVGTDTLTYQAQIALVREGTSGLLGWSFLTNAVGSPTERLRITSAGNVGIGTNSPGYSLDVQTASGTTLARFKDTDSTYGGIIIAGDTNAGWVGNSAAIQGEGIYYQNSANLMRFYTASAERMRIDSSGNVGIGTTSPASKLNVVGDQLVVSGSSGTAGLGLQIKGTVITALPTAQVQGYIATGDSTIGTAGDLLIAPRTNTTASVRFITGTTPAERMRIDSAGNVGIGTSSPSGQFEVFNVLTVPVTNTTTIANKRGLSIYNNQSGGFLDTTLVYGNGVNSYLAIGHHNGTSYAERMRITSTGNVGIGTSSPDTELHIEDATGNAVVQIESSATGYSAVFFGDVNDGDVGQIRYDHSDNSMRFGTDATAEVMRITSTGNVGIGNGKQYYWGTGRTAIQGTSASDIMQFFTASSERLRIDSSGNVGIGTTGPSAKLMSQVNTFTDADKVALKAYNAQGVGAYASFQNSATGTAFTDGFRIGIDDSENAVLQNLEATNMLFATSGTERMRIDSNGRVGIGTTSMSYLLDVRDAAGAIINVQTASGNTAVRIASLAGGVPRLDLASSSGTQSIYGGVGGVNNMVFYVNATEAMRLDASGNLLLGLTAIASLGTINTGVVLRDNESSLFARNTDGNLLQFYSGSGLAGSISVTGSATAYNTSSDYRLKESIQPIFGASDRVRQLNPVNFAWKADGTRTDGFIAHEVQAVAPQAVTGEKDGEEMQAIDHSKLVPLLTAALQEALTEIADLKARITALEA